MNFENLQIDLFEKKLKLREYFGKSFELLKVFFKENKLWFILLTIGNTWLLFSNILTKHAAINMKIAENTGDNRSFIGAVFLNLLILCGIFVVLLGLGLLKVIIYTKVGYKIEGKEKEYRFENAFFKYLKYIGLYLLFVIAITVVVMILTLITTILGIATKEINSVFVGYTIIAIPIIIYIAIILAFILNTLYFFQIFYIRNIKVWESFKYNLYLSKKNRLRIIIPTVIITLINLIFVAPFSFSMFIFLPNFAVFFIALVFGFLTGVLQVVAIIMNVVVFLNVEYNYLKQKKQEKNKCNDNSLEDKSENSSNN